MSDHGTLNPFEGAKYFRSSWELKFPEAESGRHEDRDWHRHRVLRGCAIMRTSQSGAQEVVFATNDKELIGFLESSQSVKLAGSYNQQAICDMSVAGTVAKVADEAMSAIKGELKQKIASPHPFDRIVFGLDESEKAKCLKSIEEGVIFCFTASGDYSYSVSYR